MSIYKDNTYQVTNYVSPNAHIKDGSITYNRDYNQGFSFGEKNPTHLENSIVGNSDGRKAYINGNETPEQLQKLGFNIVRHDLG